MKASICTSILLLLLYPALACAHKNSDSYLNLTLPPNSPSIEGRWDIALRDLDFVIGLDVNADDNITWGEVRAQSAAIGAYALQRLRLRNTSASHDDECPTRLEQLLIDHHVDGAYAVLQFNAACSAPPDEIAIDYALLFAVDQNHRGLVSIRTHEFHHTSALTHFKASAVFDVRRASAQQQLGEFIAQGIWHIWHGYDHIVFLFTLLLPAVVTYRSGGWQPRTSLRDSSMDILKVVTAFTAAHSVTLALGALEFVQLPTRIVETAIAMSVLLGALNILFPLVRARFWTVAFVFGLLHGLGFASVLGDLDVPPGELMVPLLGFNLGVEIGQCLIVAAVMPVTYLLRHTVFYRRWMLPIGAVLVSGLAIYWISMRWTT